MHYIRAVLRRAAAERRMTGSERARDAAIEQFLDELQAVFTPRLIQALDDALVASLYEDWLRALPHLDATERQRALIHDVSLSPVAFLVYRTHRERGKVPADAGDADPANVVSLHAR